MSTRRPPYGVVWDSGEPQIVPYEEGVTEGPFTLPQARRYAITILTDQIDGLREVIARVREVRETDVFVTGALFEVTP